MAIFSLIGSVVSGVAGALGAAGGAVASGVGGGLAGLSSIASLAGVGIQAYGSMQAAKGAEQAEALRQRQMNLQATREKRNTIRQSIVARAQALSAGTAQGGTGGSGLMGGLGQIAAQGASNLQGISQGQELGNQMFDANRQISRGQTMQSIGAGFQSLGSYLSQGFEQFSRAF
jgi:hypothetical protein